MSHTRHSSVTFFENEDGEPVMETAEEEAHQPYPQTVNSSLRASFVTAMGEHEQVPDLLNENFLDEIENSELDNDGRASQQPAEDMRGSFVSAMLTEHEQVPDLLSQAILEEEDLSTLSSPTTVSALPHGAPMTRRSRLFGQGFSQHVFPTWRQYPKWYWKRMIGIDQSLDVYGFYPAWDQIYAFVFTCLTLVILALIEFYAFYPTGNHSLNSFIPAFGASCCVVFGIPKAPIAQPRNLLFSHVTAAIIGTALTNAFRTVSEQPFGQHCAGAIGVGLHLVLMMLTETMHPPASATVISAATQTLNAYYKDEGFLFVVVPVLFGSVIIFIMACLLNNLVGDRSPYPQYW